MTNKEVRAYGDIAPDEQEKMKQKFLRYISVAKIAREHGVKRTTLQYHATTHWTALRENLKAETFSEFMDTKRENFVKMSQSSMSIIASALIELAQRDMPPTMREAQMAVNVLAELDKITRLDDGNPTEITAEKPMSIENIRAKLALNPFGEDVKEVEFKEVKENKETEEKGEEDEEND